MSGVKGVENDMFLIPKRSDEVSSTLPPLEEEPRNSSYAAAEERARIRGLARGSGRTTEGRGCA